MPIPRNRLKWNATCKVYPAICDIQAPDDTVRVYESFIVTVPGNNERLIYECPAGKCAVIQYAWGYCAQADPGSMYFIVKVGAQVYYLVYEVHGAPMQHFINPNVFLEAGDFFGAEWAGCIANNVLKGTVLGYEISQY